MGSHGMSLHPSKSVEVRKILEYSSCPVMRSLRFDRTQTGEIPDFQAAMTQRVETLTTTKKAKMRTPEDIKLNLVTRGCKVQRGGRSAYKWSASGRLTQYNLELLDTSGDPA